MRARGGLRQGRHGGKPDSISSPGLARGRMKGQAGPACQHEREKERGAHARASGLGRVAGGPCAGEEEEGRRQLGPGRAGKEKKKKKGRKKGEKRRKGGGLVQERKRGREKGMKFKCF
jgi:hypothetical protein